MSLSVWVEKKHLRGLVTFSSSCVWKRLINNLHRYCTYVRYPVLLNKTVQKKIFYIKNVGAPCKMSAPYVKCRRLKCRRPRQNVGALKCRRPSENVGAHEIFQVQEATAPYTNYKIHKRNCTCTKYSKSINMCAYMKCRRPVKHVRVS